MKSEMRTGGSLGEASRQFELPEVESFGDVRFCVVGDVLKYAPSIRHRVLELPAFDRSNCSREFYNLTVGHSVGTDHYYYKM